MKKGLIGLSLLCAVSGSQAFADQPTFNYIDVGYRDFEDNKGLTINASAGISEYIYLSAAYNDLTFDETFGGRDIDTELYDIGVGFKHSISTNSAFFIEAEYVKSEISSGRFSTDDSGRRFRAGIRATPNDIVEFYGDIANLDFNGSVTELTLGFKTYITDNVGLFAQAYRNDFEADSFSVGLSLKF